jgi:CDP-glucose 4,6-dehydratase
VARVVAETDPQVVFHLAAQPIVREAFREPLATFATNVMGTVNVLEACRAAPSLASVVVYTTDKVYRNDQSGRAFREDERLGGNEPYSASKAAADVAVAAWWESYFRLVMRPPAVAIVRAGNIIGGGDWAGERLFPDAMRAFGEGRTLVLRNPRATRPWQHVLDAVRGTLVLAERDADPRAPAEDIAWNFGPAAGAVHAVSEVAGLAARAWGGDAAWREDRDESIPESRALVLSSERAADRLGWRCLWPLRRAVDESVTWYRAAREGGDLLALTRRQIEAHTAEAGA